MAGRLASVDWELPRVRGVAVSGGGFHGGLSESWNHGTGTVKPQAGDHVHLKRGIRLRCDRCIQCRISTGDLLTKRKHSDKPASANANNSCMLDVGVHVSMEGAQCGENITRTTHVEFFPSFAVGRGLSFLQFSYSMHGVFLSVPSQTVCFNC